MSRESIAFLKKWQDRQRRKRSGKCQKNDHLDQASIVPVLFQKNNDRFMAAREAKLCFKMLLEALILLPEIRASRSLTRQRRIIQKT